MTQDGPKIAPRWPKMAPRWPQDGPKKAQDAPQDGTRMAQDAPKIAPRWPSGSKTALWFDVTRTFWSHFEAKMSVSPRRDANFANRQK